MADTAQHYQKLLTEALQKQMVILGPQIALMKAKKVPGMSIDEHGQVTAVSEDPQRVATLFLEAFREISAPLVKKTMKPLLSAIGPTAQIQQPHPTPENSENQHDRASDNQVV